MNIEKLKEVFKKYVEKYDMTDKNIIRKFYHSYRVMDLCMMLADDNNFNKEDMEIAILIGLLHDYARFEQWTKFGTYNDLISIDHGDLAVKKLFDEDEIINYCTNKKYYDEIYDAIKYHNKYSYPDNLSEHNKLFCKLIRDADKLDIFYLLGTNSYGLLGDNKDISEKISKDFYNNKLLNNIDVKNESDKVISFLAMVFDLNFYYSYRYLYDMKLIDKLLNNIVDKEKFRPYFDYINKYLEDKINNN